MSFCFTTGRRFVWSETGSSGQIAILNPIICKIHFYEYFFKFDFGTADSLVLYCISYDDQDSSFICGENWEQLRNKWLAFLQNEFSFPIALQSPGSHISYPQTVRCCFHCPLLLDNLCESCLLCHLIVITSPTYLNNCQ